jgi:hypothetical protein
MAVTQKFLDGLEKLYAKRREIDVKIVDAEKKLVSGAKADIKVQVKAVSKPPRKPRAKKKVSVAQ